MKDKNEFPIITLGLKPIASLSFFGDRGWQALLEQGEVRI